jgi:flagellar hook-basal body complex protein FliE
MTAAPIAPVTSLTATGLLDPTAAAAPAQVGAPESFARMLLDGVDQVNQKVLDADKMVQAFALDDSVPLHQVTFALEQARLSTELMMQVRARVLEGYQELMRMQL